MSSSLSLSFYSSLHRSNQLLKVQAEYHAPLLEQNRQPVLLATQAAPLLHLPFLHPQASIASAELQLLNSGGPCVIAHCRTYGTEEKRHPGRNRTAGRRRNRAESVQLQGLGVRPSGTKMAWVSVSFGRAGILGSGLGNCWSCCFLVYCQNYFLEVYIGHSWRCSKNSTWSILPAQKPSTAMAKIG